MADGIFHQINSGGGWEFPYFILESNRNIPLSRLFYNMILTQGFHAEAGERLMKIIHEIRPRSAGLVVSQDMFLGIIRENGNGGWNGRIFLPFFEIIE
ncbi:MAG: hypothetical protein C6W57_16165 [Caldibacillus debilis]|nr:MAG: hypothetical protein C6W57_16165 [Caldibacillus debilis]